MGQDGANPTVFLNGELLPLSRAHISPLDRGFLYGDGIFETLRAYQKRAFRLDDHLERFSRSAAALKLPMPYSAAAIKEAIRSLLEANKFSDASIRIALSRGVGPRGPSIRGPFQPTLAIVVSPFHGYPADWLEKGIRVAISSVRLDAASPLPRHKTANYLPYILAREEADEAGAAEGILLNSREEVAEAAAANVFIVSGGKALTPSLEANILPGSTRGMVREICGERRIPAEERLFGAEQLLRADEVFLTNSLMEIMPVAVVADRVIGRGAPGPVTRLLTSAYREKVRCECRPVP
jgi:branched-chain amino acid aminotransferase